ncbi:hypothetical protein ILYODFUR_033144 [Ilyodon furcidens]|uniref:Uncharacterized protein n=1 Tax=Ilyodon furcidens TaxID=33524 RepID=A0ABV0VJ47_9TELE
MLWSRCLHLTYSMELPITAGLVGNMSEIIFSILDRRFQISLKLSVIGSTTGLPDSSHEKSWIILALTTCKQILLTHWGQKRESDEKMSDGILDKLYQFHFIQFPFTSWLSVT